VRRRLRDVLDRRRLGCAHLHAWLRGEGWRREVEIPRELRDLEQRALALPDEARLRALGRALAARNDGALGAPRRVEILVVARRFEAAELTPSGVPIASFDSPVE
jgi:hypothetical protein